jgi:hypothetical protein
MIDIRIESKPVNPSDYRKKHASIDDAPQFIDHFCRVFVGDSEYPSIVYSGIDIDTSALRDAVCSIKYTKETRTSGLPTQSRIFGYSPRLVVRAKEACTVTSLAHEKPHQHSVVTSFASYLSSLYLAHNPMVYQKHMEETRIVLDDWKIGETPFTSGIINKNNQLPYHFDAGNVKNVWSNMVVFKKDVIGGYLACPELGATFELKDNSVLMFDGQNILHGVTPFKKISPQGYRYSIVYYSLLQMWHCLPPKEEIKEAAKRRRAREVKRANG